MDVIALIGILSACLVMVGGTALTGWRLDVVSRRRGGTDDYFWVAFGGVVVVAGAGVVAAALGGLWVASLAAVVSIPAVWLWVSRRQRRRREEAERAARTTAWSELRSRHDAVVERWADYDLDPAKAIDHPEMHDPSHPAARRMVNALRRAESARDIGAQSQPDDVSNYVTAVQHAEEAFEMAEHEVGVHRTERAERHRELPG